MYSSIQCNVCGDVFSTDEIFAIIDIDVAKYLDPVDQESEERRGFIECPCCGHNSHIIKNEVSCEY